MNAKKNTHFRIREGKRKLSKPSLEKSLGPWMLWGLGVGYVISGMYFGWNLGLPLGGTLGMAIATVFISIMYVFFTMCYTEMACAIPKAGGAFDYANLAFGEKIGIFAGLAQWIEFLFAPPAIAFAIGAYFHEFFPELPVLGIASFSFFIFTFINIIGVRLAAQFELFITCFAVFELLLFASWTLPSFRWENLTANPLPNGYLGVFACFPFAIWFFLAIEGIANVAEETENPQKNIRIGFFSAIATLVFLCFLTFFSAIGVAGWEAIVYPDASDLNVTSDSPLPLALFKIVGKDSVLYHLLITIGLFGLVASFHGIILAAGRITFEFGRTGFLPKGLGRIHQKFHTPYLALIFNMAIGLLALITGKTSEIITIACFGALGLYILSLLSYFRLKTKEPNLPRPFIALAHPIGPAIALAIALVAFGSMIVFHPWLACLFFSLLCLGFFTLNYIKAKE